MDSGDVSRWRAYFRSSGSTIFDLIENAITVAALDHPSELRLRMEKIVRKMYRCDLRGFSTYDSQSSEVGSSFSSSRVSSGGYEGSKSSSDSDGFNSKTLQEVSKIMKVLENIHCHSDALIVELLRKLLRIDVNVQILQTTMIGAAVSPLGKHGSREIRHLVRDLIRKWREVVDESLKNADDKISENRLGDHNVTLDGPSNAKEPSLNLQQDPLQCNFFGGLAPVSPAVASSDLLKIFQGVDEEKFFSILPPDDGNGSDELSFPALKSIGKGQHIDEKPSLVNPTGKSEIGVQSWLIPNPLKTHGRRKLAAVRAVHVMESNLRAKGIVEAKNKVDTIKTSQAELKAKGNSEAAYKPDASQKPKRIDDADKFTLEEARKVIKAGYEQDRKRRRVVQMLHLNELLLLKPKHEKK